MILPAEIRREGFEIEALTSVFRGICETNHLRMRSVLKKLSFPDTCAYLPDASSEFPLYAANHGNKVTSDTGTIIKALTGYEATQVHSFAAWNARDPARTLVTVSTCRKWCGDCYLDDARSGRRIYDRLIWMPTGVEVCVRHGTRLQSRCPNCGQQNFSFIRNDDVAGYCPKCHAWLGVPGRVYPREHDDMVNYRWWIARCVAEMVERGLPNDADPFGNFSGLFSRAVDIHFAGNGTLAGKYLGRSKSLISEWRNGVVTPQWKSLCDVSYAFQVPIQALLNNDQDAIAFSSLARLPSQILHDRPQTAVRNRAADTTAIERFMRQILAGKHPTITRFRQIGERFLVNRTTPQKHFPELAAEVKAVLAERLRAKTAQSEKSRLMLLHEEVQSVALDFYNRQQAIRRRSLVDELTCRGCKVRRRDYAWTLALANQVASRAAAGKLAR